MKDLSEDLEVKFIKIDYLLILFFSLLIFFLIFSSIITIKYKYHPLSDIIEILLSPTFYVILFWIFTIIYLITPFILVSKSKNKFKTFSIFFLMFLTALPFLGINILLFFLYSSILVFPNHFNNRICISLFLFTIFNLNFKKFFQE